jgi:hypothetical protein
MCSDSCLIFGEIADHCLFVKCERCQYGAFENLPACSALDRVRQSPNDAIHIDIIDVELGHFQTQRFELLPQSGVEDRLVLGSAELDVD